MIRIAICDDVSIIGLAVKSVLESHNFGEKLKIDGVVAAGDERKI